MRRHKGAPKCPWGEITIKGAKGLVDNLFFMYHVYFENISHITFKLYKYIFLHYVHLLMKLPSSEFVVPQSTIKIKL
jgi:hypothetical protein